MKAFDFVAFNSSGKRELGVVRAWSLPEAKKKIQESGFYLTSIKAHNTSVRSGVAIQREGSRGTSSHGQNSLSLFKWLKEFFFSRERISF
jgi:type II secretory pathway component PulF